MSDWSSRRDADLQRLEGVLQLDWLILGHDGMLVQVAQSLAEHVQGILDVASFELPKQNVSTSPVGSNQARAAIHSPSPDLLQLVRNSDILSQVRLVQPFLVLGVILIHIPLNLVIRLDSLPLGKLPTVRNRNGLQRLVGSVRCNVLDVSDESLSADYFAEYDVFSVEVWCGDGRDEEL
jgi:hypothetical protein